MLKKKLLELNSKVDSFYSTSIGAIKKTIKNSSSQIFENQEKYRILNSLDFYWNNKDLFTPLENDYYKDYTNLIQERLAIIKQQESFTHLTSLNKNHNESTDYQINYIFKSFHVQMINLNNDHKYSLKNQEFYLPFSLIPVVFSLSENELFFFISSVVSFNYNFSEIVINYEKALNFINKYDFSCEVIKHPKVIKFDWITPNIIYEVIIK